MKEEMHRFMHKKKRLEKTVSLADVRITIQRAHVMVNAIGLVRVKVHHIGRDTHEAL